MPACHKCGLALGESDYGRQETCSGCGAHTRCCMNCRNYDASRYNECVETIADRVVDKEKFNFCDHFKPGERAEAGGGLSAAEKARQAAEALFKRGK